MLGGSVGAATPLSVFEPVAPSLRLAETRPEFGASGFTRVNSQTIRVAVAGRTVKGTTIPSDAVAAVFSVVGINLHPGGSFVTAYPSRTTIPNTSNLNMQVAGDVVNNLVTVKLGSDGNVEFLVIATTRAEGDVDDRDADGSAPRPPYVGRSPDMKGSPS